MKSDIKQVLSYLGVSPKYMGYYYIIDASDIIIKQLKRNKPILIDRIIKELAIKYNTNYFNVEKNMRTCIESTFRRGNINNIDKLFYSIQYYYDERPSNKLFLTTIANYLNNKK